MLRAKLPTSSPPPPGSPALCASHHPRTTCSHRHVDSTHPVQGDDPERGKWGLAAEKGANTGSRASVEVSPMDGARRTRRLRLASGSFRD